MPDLRTLYLFLLLLSPGACMGQSSLQRAPVLQGGIATEGADILPKTDRDRLDDSTVLISGDLSATPVALAEARDFAKDAGEALWPGYGSAPFGFLLIDPEVELLFCQPGAPEGFLHNGRDPHTGCSVLSRSRTGLPDTLLAAMPVFGPPSTIVMGSPEATGRSKANWKRTILHERFHQWQASLPNYYARVDALDLAGDNATGMWMLNYAFPYSDAAVRKAYRTASIALADALDRRDHTDFLQSFDRYLVARQAFAETISQKDWRYLEFQLWQEGAARWTEIELAMVHPDIMVRADAKALEGETLMALRAPDLKKQGRLVAYSLGAGEAMLMQSCGPEWRAAYPHVLEHGELLIRARQACST